MKNSFLSHALLAAFLSGVGLPALAQDATSAPAESQGLLPIPDYTGDLMHRSYLAGDFNGGRTKLADKGIQFDVEWTQYLQSAVDGGRDTGSRYGGNLDYLIHLDLSKMGVLPGALVTFRAESRYGQGANDIAGPILPVNTKADFPLTQTIDQSVPFTITDLNYTQFLSSKFAVFLGKLDTLGGDPNEFASGRGVSQFMNANFIFNSTTALRLPYSTLGVGINWLPLPNISVSSSVLNTVDSSTTSGFNDLGSGATWSSEIDAQYHLGRLPGGMSVGGLYSFDQDFAKITGSLIFQPGSGFVLPTKSDTWAVYWSGWQYVLIRDPDDKPIQPGDGVQDHEGLGVFARAGFADRDTNPIEWSLSVGVGGRGLIPTRGNDVYGFGYYYTRIQANRFTAIADIRNNSQGMEAFYNVAITPASHLTFDLQIQDTPLPHIDTSVILGIRFNVVF